MTKRVLAGIAVGVVMSICAGAAGATTLTFDSDFVDSPPFGDGGLTYTNFFVINDDCCGPSGYANGNVSASKEIFNADGDPASFSGVAFTLNSFFLTAAWHDGLNVLVEGKNGATVTHSINLAVGPTAPTLETLNWTNLTEVLFTASGGTPHGGFNGDGTQFVIDNLTINAAGAPEPAGWALMLAGFGGLGAALRRRRRAALA